MKNAYKKFKNKKIKKNNSKGFFSWTYNICTDVKNIRYI